MLNFIFKIMIILPIFQTWLIWNGFYEAKYIEHILYIIFSLYLCYYILLNKPNIHKNVILLIFVFYLFICCGMLMTLFQEMHHGYVSGEGIIYEVYKLTRNLFIFLFSYLFQSKKQIIQNIKLYIGVMIILVTTSIFEYFYGFKAYQFLHFYPSYETYPDFYNVYLRDNRTMGLTKHPIIYSTFVLVALFILIFASVMNIKIFRTKFAQYSLTLYSLIGIFISSSRSVFISSIIIPIILSFVYRIRKIVRMYVVLLIISAPFLVFAINQFIFKLWQYKYYTFELGHTEYRLLSWKDAINIFVENGFIGSGFGTWGDASASFSDFKINDKTNIMSDSYLSHLLAENGVGLIFIAIIFCYSLYYLHKNVISNTNVFYEYLNIVCVSLLLFTFMESFKSMQLSMYEDTIFMFYLFGYIFRINSTKEKFGEDSGTKQRWLYKKVG